MSSGHATGKYWTHLGNREAHLSLGGRRTGDRRRRRSLQHRRERASRRPESPRALSDTGPTRPSRSLPDPVTGRRSRDASVTTRIASEHRSVRTLLRCRSQRVHRAVCGGDGKRGRRDRAVRSGGRSLRFCRSDRHTVNGADDDVLLTVFRAAHRRHLFRFLRISTAELADERCHRLRAQTSWGLRYGFSKLVLVCLCSSGRLLARQSWRETSSMN